MPRREKEPISRHHFWIYTRDVERLRVVFGDSIGMSNAVRQILHHYLNRIEARSASAARHPEVTHEIDFRSDHDAGIPTDSQSRDEPPSGSDPEFTE